MKKIYLTIFASLFLPVAVFATGDLTLGTGAVISISGISINVSGSNAVVDSITVNASDFTVTMSENQTLELTSAARKVISVTQTGSLQITSTCSSSNSVYTIKNPAGGVVVTPTITVSSDTCSQDSGGVSGGGGGGGGGGGYAPAVPPQTPEAIVAAAAQALAAATPAAPAVAQPSPVAVSVSPVFTSAMSKGSKGDDVTRLQQLLASDSSIYPEGTVSGFFGSLTEKAVQKFQEKYGIAKAGDTGYGVVGPKTRAKLQEVFGGAAPVEPAAPATPAAPAVAQPSPVAVSVSPVFTSAMSKGSKGDDVTRLQQLLASDSSIYPEGTVSGFFGSLTEKAVQKFQEKYGIAKAGDTGYGVVGPKTRAKLQEVFGGAAPVEPAAPATPVTPQVITPSTSGDQLPSWMQMISAPTPQ